MNIHLNGEARAISGSHTLAELIIELELSGQRIAVEINGDIAPRSQHASITLRANDRIEIVRAIGGG
jgi:sulfur carrier protein